MNRIDLLNLMTNLHGKTWEEVNLDQLARLECGVSNSSKPSPLIDPVACARWVDSIPQRLGVDFTYGGLYENRAHLWRGSYLDSTAVIHLGIDINVPVGTVVRCPRRFQVIQLLYDDQPFGWGGRAVVKVGEIYIIFAHLELRNFSVGCTYERGEDLGFVASSKTNGGWYPHIHVQAFGNRSQLDEPLDGYGSEKDTKLFIDPLYILSYGD